MGAEAQAALILKAMNRGGFETYSALARHVGVSTATMSQWRNGSVPLSQERIVEFCKIARENEGVWAMLIYADNTNVSSLGASIRMILKNAGATLIVALALLPIAGKAAIRPGLTEDGYMHYAK